VSLAGAQLGVTLASVALGFVAEPAVAHLLEPAFAAAGVSDAAAEVASFGVGLVIVVFAHMVIGEMVPKNLAIAGPERAALLLAGPLRLYTIVLGLVIRLLNWLANSVLRLAGVEPADELATAATADDLASMIAESRDEGFLDDFEEGFLSGALHFDDATAASVMVARDQIVAASASTTVAELEALVVETRRSRIPVYVETLDQVIGFFHAKALLDMPAEARGEPMAPRLLRPLLLVPPTVRSTRFWPGCDRVTPTSPSSPTHRAPRLDFSPSKTCWDGLSVRSTTRTTTPVELDVSSPQRREVARPGLASGTAL